MNKMTRLALPTLMLLGTSIPTSTLLAESIRTNEVSSGACMIICSDVSFCKDYGYNDQTGTCTFSLDTAAPDYSRQQSNCPQVSPDNWVISYSDDSEKWKITCPSSIRREIDKPLPSSPSDRF